MDKHIRTEYVIGIQRIRDFQGNLLEEKKRKWEYAQLSMPANPYAVNWEAKFAPFDAKPFASTAEAKEWLNEYKKYLIPEIRQYYDANTLGIYKKFTVVTYQETENINIKDFVY